MSASQIPTSVTIIDSLHGFMGLSLTEYTTSAAAAIAAGSVVEVAGAFFTFVADDTPEASTWTSITTGTTAYIALTPSGTAGSQILSATYTSTAPTWRDDLQGWYASAASSTRVVASVYKAESTSYYPKYIYNPKTPESYRQSGKEIFTSSGVFHVPLGVNTVYLTGCSAGGNGGTGSGVNSGGGGGAGAIVYRKPFTVTAGTSVIVTIGAVGSVTSFGSTSFNFGGNGGSVTAGTGGALGSATVAGGSGGAGGTGAAGSTGSTVGFAYGGTGGTYGGSGGGNGGGGAGGLGVFGYYFNNTDGASAGVSTGGTKGALLGGGGGGAGGAFPSGASAIGGNGGYGSGGGGGGGSGSGTGAAGGSGGPAILIVEW